MCITVPRSLAYYQLSEAYSEPCQTSKMERFIVISIRQGYTNEDLKIVVYIWIHLKRIL